MSALTAEPHTASAPARSESLILEQLQQTVSASRLSCFLQCRLKFWFRYVAELKKPKTPALHLGGSVHQVLKAWNMARWKGEPLSLKQLFDVYATSWSDQASEPVAWDNDEEAQKATGWRLVETYFRESNIPASLKPEAVEVPVQADLASHGLPSLVGVIDLVQQSRIVDFKTSSTTPTAEKMAHTSEVQSCAYAVLYRDATGKRETGIEFHTLVKLKNPKLVVTALEPMSERQQTRLFRLIDAYVNGLQRADFIPSPGMQCSSCEF
jgi:putative RecB family exonuclease